MEQAQSSLPFHAQALLVGRQALAGQGTFCPLAAC